jgi:hypothetical protein
MNEMPVVGYTFLAGILAHGGNENPVAKYDGPEGKE